MSSEMALFNNNGLLFPLLNGDVLHITVHRLIDMTLIKLGLAYIQLLIDNKLL
jgi:hypothetical protein